MIRLLGTTAAVSALALGTAACSTNDSAGPGQPSGKPAPSTVTGTPPTPGELGTVSPELMPTGNPTKTPPGGVPRPGQVNSFDATTVAVTVAAVTYRHDTTIDNSPSDAQRRARPWLARELAAQLEGGLAAAPGAEWNMWTQHRAYTISTAVDATESGAPEDTATRADRAVAVTVRPVGRDRWRGRVQQRTLFITLTRTNAKAPWLVSQMERQG